MIRPRTILLGLLGATLFALSLAGCAVPLRPGPIVAYERAEFHDGEYALVETREHPDRLTYAFIAHDGILVEPVSPEDEAWLLNPEDRAVEIIERLNHTVPIARRSVVPFW